MSILFEPSNRALQTLTKHYKTKTPTTAEQSAGDPFIPVGLGWKDGPGLESESPFHVAAPNLHTNAARQFTISLLDQPFGPGCQMHGLSCCCRVIVVKAR